MDPKKQGFCSKIISSQMKLLYFVNWHRVGPTKNGPILESKVVQKLSLQKNVLYKKWSPKLIFLDENFFWKNLVDFWRTKLSLKVRFFFFWQTVFLKQIPLSMLILGQKFAIKNPPSLKLHNRTDIRQHARTGNAPFFVSKVFIGMDLIFE